MLLRKKTKVDLLIEVLSDGKWHSGDELAMKVGHRFGDAIHKARKLGYLIETNNKGGSSGWYRLHNN